MTAPQGRVITTDTDKVRRMLVVLLIIVIASCGSLVVQVHGLRSSVSSSEQAVDRNAIVLCKEFHVAHPTLPQLSECLQLLKKSESNN